MANFVVNAAVRQMDWESDPLRCEAALRSQLLAEATFSGRTITGTVSITVGELDEQAKSYPIVLEAPCQ